jgi:hypothetical protein
MDLQTIIDILKPIPKEFHYNDGADRAIAVAIKRLEEAQHADVSTSSDE